MKTALFALILASFTGAAFAQETAICFERKYSAEHLRQNPKQQVKTIRVTLTQEDNLYNSIEIETRKPIKGHTKFSSGGGCRIATGALHCGFDADGGNFLFDDQGKQAFLKVSSALFLYHTENSTEDESEGRDLILSPGAANGVYRLNSVPCN